MSYRAEDKLRSVLSARVSAVDTPPGWISRITAAGRRRRRRRRVSIVTLLIATLLTATYVLKPEWWEPALPPAPSAPLIDLSDLGEGDPLQLPHASGNGSNDIVALPSRTWASDGIVTVLERARDGVVAVVEREPVADRVEYHLVYVDAERMVEIDTGEPPTTYVDDLAVSKDGRRLAWTSTGGGATTLHLARCPKAGSSAPGRSTLGPVSESPRSSRTRCCSPMNAG